MYCPKCGSQNSDQMKYCQKCGSVLHPYARSGGSMPQTSAGFSSGQLIEALRRLINSPVYLVAVIGLTVQIIMSIIVSATGYSQYANILYQILNESGLNNYLDYYTMSQVYGLLNDTNVLSTIISNLPSIAICTGLWILYAQSCNQMRRIDTTGLTVIRVAVLVKFVLYAIGLAVGVILTFIGIAALSSYVDEAWVFALGAILIIAAAGTLTILYYLKVLKMIGSAKDIIVLDQKTAPAYLYVIVLTFAGAGLQCIGALTSLAALGIFAFLSNAAGATAGIGFGLLMNKFNLLEMNRPARQINRAGGMQGNVQGNMPYGVNGTPQAPGPENVPNRRKEPNYYQVQQQNFNTPKPGTTVLGYDEEENKKKRYANEGTMVLSDNFDMPQAKLIRIRDNKEIYITKPSFTIGKAYGDVDYFIEDNPAISRKHALIALNEGKFYVMDTNSTNHVFIDGKPIPSQTPVQLVDGMKVRFADEMYQFRMG